MRSQFLAMRIRPANRDIPRDADGSLPECWLIVEWPPGAEEPTKYWLSNMDTRISMICRRQRYLWCTGSVYLLLVAARALARRRVKA
jgi:hypothetical protein